jgi:hypothetical protein
MEDQQEVHLRIRTRELIGKDIEDKVTRCICVYVMESMSVLLEI